MTTAELLHIATHRHNILWTDLAARVVKNEGCSQEAANRMVVQLIRKESCSAPLAMALIELIGEIKNKNREHAAFMAEADDASARSGNQ